MLLVYFSKTANVSRLINKLNQPYFKQVRGTADLIVDEPVLLITYTTGMGEIPHEVYQFCQNNQSFLLFVMASGNRNWGKLFARSGDLIEEQFGAKLLYKFELSGNKNDLYNIGVHLKNIYNSLEQEKNEISSQLE